MWHYTTSLYLMLFDSRTYYKLNLNWHHNICNIKINMSETGLVRTTKKLVLTWWQCPQDHKKRYHLEISLWGPKFWINSVSTKIFNVLTSLFTFVHLLHRSWNRLYTCLVTWSAVHTFRFKKDLFYWISFSP